MSQMSPEDRDALRAQLESQLAALDAQQLDATAGPLATPSAPAPVTDTATAPPAQPGDATAAQQPAGYSGPKVGEAVAHSYVDPYANDAEVTRFGLVVATHPADPDVAGSVDRAEIAWLPEGTAVIDVTDLDSL